MTVVGDRHLQDFLDALHAKSDEQNALIQAFEARRDSVENSPNVEEIRSFRSDKLVALDRDKAEFCYQFCRAKKVSRVIEVGTSYGVCRRSILLRLCAPMSLLSAAKAL